MDYTDLNESMGAFESAVTSAKAHVKMPSCGTVLLALDGSNQDETAIALAAAVAPRLRSNVRVTICCYTGEADKPAAERAVKLLRDKGADAEPMFEEGRLPAERILAAQKKTNAGLVIAPAPYIGDIGLLKDESLSSTIDVLLAELHCALLIVRQPLEDPARHLRRLVVPMTAYNATIAAAAGWAFSLAEGDSTIELCAVADRHVMDEAAALTGRDDPDARSPEALMRAEQRLAGGMISAIQNKATETSVNVEVEVAAGDPVSIAIARVHHAPSIAVIGAPLEKTSAAYHMMQDVALGSNYPVLVARA